MTQTTKGSRTAPVWRRLTREQWHRTVNSYLGERNIIKSAGVVRQESQDLIDASRALGDGWEFMPKQIEQIHACHPGLSKQEFEESYWVCDGYCMLCAEPLGEDGKCVLSRGGNHSP